MWVAGVLWTAAIAVVLMWEIADEWQQAVDIAHGEALGVWQKEAAIFRWAAAMGRIYVPVTERTRPDANLSHLPERDISTPSGQKLTLISPPMVVNGMRALDTEPSGVKGDITSLKPMRPQDAPDPWEKNALESIAHGKAEVCGEATIDGKPYFRLMRPLAIDDSCLTCHAEQGYKVGDLRGGLSISVPMESVQGMQLPDVIHRLLGYGGMWLLGLGGIGLMSRRLQQQVQHRYQAEQKLQEAHALLEQRVAERTTDLAEANHKLESEIADRKQAEQWLLESEQRFRSCFEQGLIGMAILSAQNEWVEVNKRLCKILGYLEVELLVTTWDELTYPEDRPMVQAEFRRLLAGAIPGFVVDTRLVRKDGRIIASGLSVQCLKKQDGTLDGILVLVQDKSPRGIL